MSLKPASTFLPSRSPIVEKDGMATFPFKKILQEWDTKLQNGLNQIGQLIGDINASTKIGGRSEGIGTTVGNIDSAGTITADGIDLSRPYLNKTTDHIGDGAGSPLAGGKAAHAALTASAPTAGDYLKFDGTDWIPFTPIFPSNTPSAPSTWLNSYNASTGTFTASQPYFSDVLGQVDLSQLTGISVTITTAALTIGGTQGSMIFTNGLLTSETQAT